MKRETMMALLAAVVLQAVPVSAVHAQAPVSAVQEVGNRITDLRVAEQGGVVYVRLSLADALDNPPASFSVADPARIAFDFPNTANALGRTHEDVRQGDLHGVNVVQVGDRTRVVLNVARVMPYHTRMEGRDLVIELSTRGGDGAAPTTISEAMATFSISSQDAGAGERSVRDIRFRRGKDGEGRIVVKLSRPDTAIDVRRQGANLVVDFLGTKLPEHLHRRSDVTDFGTPVVAMTAQPQGEGVRLSVTPAGSWEHVAYQSDNEFVLEVRRFVEDPGSLVQGAARGDYQGDKLSLNFQNVDIRSVLQVIADFTDFNIVTSDSVQGNLTLRLKDVPWDQALDIILQAKGLDMRKSGSVIWIAPADELATREKLLLEAQAQRADLEPLQTEIFQINYHKAEEIFEFLKDKDQTALSERGSVVSDSRSNKLFITDVGARLESIRRIIKEIDVSPRQVLIEARIVEATKGFGRDLGVRLGVGGAVGRTVGFDAAGRPIRQGSFGGDLQNTSAYAGQMVGASDSEEGNLPRGINLDLAANPASGIASALSMILWNNDATRFLNLELSALESDGRGRIVSSPRVLTANNQEANIEQGTEIPYIIIVDGTRTVMFRKAVLRLNVKPNITPDGRIQLKVKVNKDRPDFANAVLGQPPIATKSVETEVIVENGGTVVLGGIFEDQEDTNETRVPLLGEMPVIKHLFRQTQRITEQSELMIFITPRIASEELTLNK